MGVDLAQITFLGLTVQTWITVVIAAFGLMVSLLTFARGWRWRAEAAPLFAMLEGDKLLRPDFSKAGIDSSDRRIPRELRRRQSFQRQSDRRERPMPRLSGLPADIGEKRRLWASKASGS